MLQPNFGESGPNLSFILKANDKPLQPKSNRAILELLLKFLFMLFKYINE